MSAVGDTTPRRRAWPSLARIALFLVANAVVLAVVAPYSMRVPALASPVVTGTLASVVALALTAVFVRWERLRIADVGAALRPGSIARVVLGFLIGAVIVALQTATTALLGHVHWMYAPGANAGTIMLMLLGYVALACREELAFHGYPLRVGARSLGVWGAQLAIAAIFALEHVAGGWTWTNAVLGAAVGSLLFGMASIATRGLAVPIGIHAAYNFCDWLRDGKGAGGVWTPIIAPGYEHRADVAGMTAYVALMLTATVGFWVWMRRGRSDRLA